MICGIWYVTKNGTFLDDCDSPQTFYSEMRYNHFTYVDREIAYFDLLDMCYQVFLILSVSKWPWAFDFLTRLISYRPNQVFQGPSGHSIWLVNTG